jgi:hypothetical protein
MRAQQAAALRDDRRLLYELACATGGDDHRRLAEILTRPHVFGYLASLMTDCARLAGMTGGELCQLLGRVGAGLGSSAVRPAAWIQSAWGYWRRQQRSTGQSWAPRRATAVEEGFAMEMRADRRSPGPCGCAHVTWAGHPPRAPERPWSTAWAAGSVAGACGGPIAWRHERMVTLKKVKVEPVQLIGWVKKNINPGAVAVLGDDHDLLAAFCESDDKRDDVALDDGSAHAQFSSLKTKLNQFRVKYEERRAALEAKREEEEEAATPADEEDDEDEEDALTGAFAILSDLEETTAFGRACLELEAALNRAQLSKRGSGEGEEQPSREALVQQHRKAIVTAAALVIGRCEQGIGLTDCFQVYRLWDTFEYKLLSGSVKDVALEVNTAMARAMKAALASYEDQDDALLGAAHKAIVRVWTIKEDAFKALIKGKQIRRAPHGATSASPPAKREHKFACLGEVLLCLPVLAKCDALARKQDGLYDWSVEPLLMKMLEKTVRKHKLVSLLGCFETIDALKYLFRMELTSGSISEKAQASVKAHLERLVVGAVAYKAKEQVRQLRTLVTLLATDPNLVCTAYEVREKTKAEGVTLAPIDLRFRRRGQDGAIAGEVESVPTVKLAEAHGYLRGRYVVKLKTVGEGVVLIVPDAWRLPPGQVEGIRHDGAMKVWLVDQVQPAALFELLAVTGGLLVDEEISCAKLRQALFASFEDLASWLKSTLGSEAAIERFGELTYGPARVLSGALLEEADSREAVASDLRDLLAALRTFVDH